MVTTGGGRRKGWDGRGVRKRAYTASGGVGQAHVHKISNSKTGQWRLVNRHSMMTRIGAGLITKKINVKADKGSFSALNWLRKAIK